jgi:hypothetical protein
MTQHLIELVKADFGNRNGKIQEDNDSPIVRLSSIAFLESNIPRGSVKSPVVTLMDNGRKRTYVMGKNAQSRRECKNTFTESKIDQIKYFLFGSLTPRSEVYIKELRIATPLLSGDGKAKLQNLVGTHEFTCNGIDCLLTIESVIAVPESVGAYWYGVQHGLYRDLERNNGVLDIGGLNTQMRLFDVEGNSLDCSFQTDFGTVDLANRITSHPLIIKQLTTELSPDVVMDAIESRRYTVDLIDFRPVFGQCLTEWIDANRKVIGLKLSGVKNIGEVMIIGGSAPLWESYEKQTNGRFFIPESTEANPINPQLIALLGMGMINV